MDKRHLVFAAAAICLTGVGWQSVRAGVVDLLFQSGRVDTVLWLEPNHPGALVARARRGDMERLRRAEPSRSDASIALGLGAERAGDTAAARRHYEEAMRNDRTFGPRWAMINFLARRGETPELTRHAQQAAVIYEGDLSALFDLCLRSGVSTDRLYRSIVPARAGAQREYLELLMRRNLPADALQPALRLADRARPKDRDLLLGYCDQLIGLGAGPKAAELWRALPRSSRGAGQCLDWRSSHIDGVGSVQLAESMARFELSGRQPDAAVVGRRWVVVEPGKPYHLRAVVTGEPAARAAVEWRWNGAAVGNGSQSDIEVVSERSIAELALTVRRLSGQPSAEGIVEITNLAVEPKSAALASVR